VAIPTPWTTTVINNAYRRLLDSANIEINVAVQRVLQGTVTSANASLPANGSRSVPITFILEAAAGKLFGICEHAAAVRACKRFLG